MITIKVGGTPLYIPKDTTLVLEQHNNSFDIDNITSDVIWTFDLPAKPNARALNQAHYINISNHKRYRCEISFAGVVVSNGYLFVQSVVDERTISCGVVLDGLGEEFGNRKLKDNDYGDDVVISQPTDSLEQHRTNWYNFLTGSLNANSIYKFFLFCCEKFYKNNEAYGYHQNQWSTLPGGNDEKNWAKYVNRLFTYWSIFTPDYRVVNTPDNSDWGTRLFNTLGNSSWKLNGYCFAPALRLDWIVQNVFRNAGFRITGNFLPNSYIKKLYLQSMNAMDGDLTQFGLDEYFYVTNGGFGIDDVTSQENSLDIGFDEQTYKGFQKNANTPTFNFRFKMDIDGLARNVHGNTSDTWPWDWSDEVIVLMVRYAGSAVDGVYPKYRSVVNHEASVKDYIYGTNMTVGNNTKIVYYDNNKIEWVDTLGRVTEDVAVRNNYENLYCIQLTSSKGNTTHYTDNVQGADIEGDYTANVFQNYAALNKNYIVEIAKFTVYTVQHGAWSGDWDDVNVVFRDDDWTSYIRVQYFGQLERLSFAETIAKKELSNTNTMMNVFDTVLRWKQHVPNVTNGDFIKKLCKFFGLSLYINPFHKTVQLSFLNDVFNAGAVDITPYITNSERMAYDPQQYKITAATVLGTKGTAEDFLMDPVMKRSDLTAARSKKRMSVFVRNENTYNIATQDEKTNKYNWETNAGNDATLTIGNEGDSLEEITTEIQVPNMKVVDTEQVPKYVCDIETRGNSKLMDDDYTGEFDMILQQYKGMREFRIRQQQPGIFKIEDANPTCYDQNGNISDDYLTLAATGHNSVGEKWLRQFYEFKASQENYRFTAKLPVDVFLQVYQLQLPQDDNERRWIIVQNRRYIPINISYEFGAGDKVLATIECARRHYDTD